MIIVSVLLHVGAIVWLAVPEPAATQPEELGILVSMTPPEPEPVEEPAAEPEPAPAPTPEPSTEVAEPEPAPVEEVQAVEPAVADAIPMHEEVQPRVSAEPAPESERTHEQAAPVADPVVAQTYEQQLVAWLGKHKRYPKLALRRGIEGECVVRLVIDREGRVLVSGIDTGSGNDMLDKEALAMVGRAAPFPSPPAEVPGYQLEYAIPVVFSLQ